MKNSAYNREKFILYKKILRHPIMYLTLRFMPRNILIRAKSYLYIESDARDYTERETFFNQAFKALSFNRIDGDYAEFGCSGGVTFSLAYHAARRLGLQMKLWAFDSFCGLPASRDEKDKHPRWIPGILKTSLEDFHFLCKCNAVPRQSYTVIPGFYEETLVQIPPTQEPTNICLAYIDCDLYSSTKSVLRFLMPRLKHGMIIAFDDYYCWSKDQLAGERRACLDYFEKNDKWQLLPYIQFGWHGLSFIVEDRRLL